jgi:lipopolysaccharide export system protein LptC
VTVARLVGLVLLAGVAALSLWLNRQFEPVREPPAAVTRGAPDYYVHDFVVSAMDEAGHLRDRLRADTLYHFPLEDASELARPSMELYREDAPPWRIDAEEGRIYGQGELVLLLGEVHIRRAASPQTGPAVEVLTRELRVRPAERYAETDQPVTLLRNGTRIDAVGMRANLLEGRLELLAAVRGRHDPLP